MTGRLVKLGIIAFWLFMTGWLVLRDILPEYYFGTPPSYQTVTASRMEPVIRQMGIYFAGERVGTTRTSIEPQADDGRIVRSDTHLTTTIPLLPTEISLVVRLDPQSRLIDFTSTLRGAGLDHTIRGHAEPMRLIIDEPAGIDPLPFNNRVPLDSAFSSSLRMKDLYLGKRWRMALLNPFQKLGAVEYATAHVIAHETITLRGTEYETYVVEVKFGSYELNRTRLWIDLDAEVVKQELPFRITLMRERPDDPTRKRHQTVRRQDGGR